VVVIVVINIYIELRAKIYCKTISVHMLAYQNRIKIHYLSDLKRPGKKQCHIYEEGLRWFEAVGIDMAAWDFTVLGI
jgi:hypothetical protein